MLLLGIHNGKLTRAPADAHTCTAELDFGYSARTLQNVIIPHLLAALASRGLI